MTLTDFPFSLVSNLSQSSFGPRIGFVSLSRPNGRTLRFQSPTCSATTSRGVVPHLSRDCYNSVPALRWTHLPFESFLEHKPPILTLQPLDVHTFLGFSRDDHAISMSIRDPTDIRQMPPNNNKFINALCIQGVRKITPGEWHEYVRSCQPDFAIAMSDVPLTSPPHSQKRLTKSNDRSVSWLTDFIRLSSQHSTQTHTLVNMRGGIVPAARASFSDNLLEPLQGKDAEQLQPYQRLDDAVAGYVFDLAPLYLALTGDGSLTYPPVIEKATQLLQVSLKELPQAKLRIVNSAESPHQILHLILHVGVDLFDTYWAQQAANYGIALDFEFPVVPTAGQADLGHNLYDQKYNHDFSTLSKPLDSKISCSCAACSPSSPVQQIKHSHVDPENPRAGYPLPAASKAYIHHLLHTHEMSAHSLLTLHNLAVLDAWFSGIRSSMVSGDLEGFRQEVERFSLAYNDPSSLFYQAKGMWAEVDKARGKGRLGRERMASEDQGIEG